MTPNQKALYGAILRLKTAEECEAFFSDLCTPGELESLADRWEVARLLDRGVPYRDIYDQTGVSTATVTRVARALKHGEGGYGKALNRSKANTKRDE